MNFKIILLYALCILFPLVPYYYSKKFRHGIVIETIVFTVVLVSLHEILYAIGRYDLNIEYYFIIFPSIILIASAYTFIDSIYHLHKHLNQEIKI